MHKPRPLEVLLENAVTDSLLAQYWQPLPAWTDVHSRWRFPRLVPFLVQRKTKERQWAHFSALYGTVHRQGMLQSHGDEAESRPGGLQVPPYSPKVDDRGGPAAAAGL